MKYCRHGLSRIPEYQVWASMKDKCNNPRNAYYPKFGGKGICVCDRWNRSFSCFYEDMGERPDRSYILARIDKERNYCQENCQWMPRSKKSYTSEYHAWQSMKARCGNPRCLFYSHYGERGIHVCDRWEHSFDNFLEDMGPKPTSQHTLERVDNESGYCPENCMWANRHQQQNNRRGCRFITALGKTMTVSQWSRETGISHGTLLVRLNNNWPEEDAVTLPVINGGLHRKKRHQKYKGVR